MRRPPNEGPRKVRVREASATFRGKRRARGRSGDTTATAAEEGSPRGIGKGFEIRRYSEPDRNWRVDLQTLHQLELGDVAGLGTPITEAIGGVVVFGLDQLQIAVTVSVPPEIALLDKNGDAAGYIALGLEANGCADFHQRWAEAMCREMGAEEVEKFAFAWRQRNHGRRS